MKRNILFTLLFLSLLYTNSCSVSKSYIDTQEIENYFKTNDIEVKVVGKVWKVIISNSELISNANNTSQVVKWVNYESYASMGAFFIFNSNEKLTNEIDSIDVIIKMDNKEEMYHYAVEDLREIKPFFNISKDFLLAWVSKDYSKAKSFLSDEINNTFPTIDDLKKTLSTVFLEVSIDNVTIIAFKVNEGIVGLYINAYYSNNNAQTYLFNFYSNSDSKIDGVSVP